MWYSRLHIRIWLGATWLEDVNSPGSYCTGLVDFPIFAKMLPQCTNFSPVQYFFQPYIIMRKYRNCIV